jgi:hypothetical protein
VINLEAMRSVAEQSFALRIERCYGPSGNDALRRLLESLKVVHRHLAYELVQGGLTVVAPLEPENFFIPLDSGINVRPSELASMFGGVGTIQVLADGGLRFWPVLIDDFAAVAESAVIYHYDRGDFFVVEGDLVPVPNPTGFPSAFGLPTFVDLERAMAYYAVSHAKVSSCKILQACWYDDDRILLRNKPEHIMRSSLAQFLKSTLRDHEFIVVREEQNVDETHPVDITITWSMSNRIAIIEVKWLGCSVHKTEARVGTTYSNDSRAQDGARQLANYLEANRERVPMHITRGYLVVFDARREGVKRDRLEQDVTWDDAVAFMTREINYYPKYEHVRRDFAPPERFYLEPRRVA